MQGIVINVDPIALAVGPFAIRWYGLAVVAAITVGLAIGVAEARRRGLDVEQVYNLGIVAVLAALVGARLAHVIDYFGYYAANPLAAFALYEGGLSIYGGVLGGLAAGALYARRAKMPLLVLLDAVAPALILAQSVGRLGCIVNGDAQGAPTDLPWAFTYVNPGALVAELGVPGHPYPVYEIIWNLLVLAVLWRLRGSVRVPGVLFLTYAGLYSLGRFFLTFVRQEGEVLWGLQQAQVIALAVLMVAMPAIVYLSRRPVAQTAGLANREEQGRRA